MKKALLNFLFIFYSVSLIGQIDTEFWFVAPEVSKNDFQRYDEPIVLRMTTFNAPASITISMPGEPSFIPLQITAVADTSVSVDLSPWLELLENKPANTILNKGILIFASAPITAYYDVVSSYCNCNPELYSLKGTNALGTEFLLPGQTQFDNAPGYSPTPYNAFDIVATENKTTVKITPAKEIVGHVEGKAFQIVLNKGQTWSGVATGQSVESHLHGTEIISDKPIAVTVSDDLLWGINCGGDLVGDQVVPVNMAGNEFIGVRGFLTNDGDRLFVLGLSNNTSLYFDGSSTPLIINRGEVYNHRIQNNSTHLLSSSPVLVYQTSGYGCELGSAVLPQIQCTGSESVSVYRSNDFQFGILLSTEVGNETGFLINGDSTIVVASDFSEVPGTNGYWLAANVVLSPAQVPVGTTCMVSNRNGVFHMGLISGGSDIGCGYGYFSNFNSLELGADKRVCEGDTAVLDAGLGMEPYLWSTGATTRTISVNSPGEYWVQAGVGSCLLSDTVKISFQQLPIIDLGPDTLAVCGAASGFIFAPDGYSHYQWNVTGNSNILEVTSPGIYHCQVTDSVGCSGSDSMYVTFGPLPANLGEAIGLPLSLQDSLVAWYPFNGNPNDETGNGNNGSVIGNVILTTDRFGNANSAYEFPGEAFNYISVPHSSYLELNTFTISTWIFTETDYAYGRIVQKNRDIFSGHYGLYTTGVGGTVSYGVDVVSGDSFEPAIGTWHMVTGTLSGNFSSFYIDGQLVDDTIAPNTFVYTGTDPMAIGMHYYEGVPDYYTYPYRGKIDDVLIYNRVLSAEEVACLYSGDCSSLKLSASLPENSLCKGGSTSLTLFNAQPGVKYQLLKGGNEYGNFQVGNSDTLIFPIANLPETTSFTILATDTTTGCSITLDSAFVVEVNDISAIAIANMHSAYIPATVEVSAQAAGASTYEWWLDGVKFADTPESQIVIDSTGTHTLVLLVSSGPPDYCTDADTLFLTTTERTEVILEIPSSFTPNADGINDHFEFATEGIDSYTVWLKDSWGVLVYEYDKSTGKWDGLTKAGKEAPAGPYYYHVAARDYTEMALERSGVVYLIRDLIELSPNPAKDKLVIKMNGRLPGERIVQVISVHGRVLSEATVSGETFELGVSGFSPGLYLLRISNQMDVLNLKFIKE
ncbi:MAG: hypothetical protein FD170_3440 [Bacteroidetes bacterium]|nr:MAG: hypothetical protein FD170_3440 [Bacteroidota bacterium]